MCQNVTVPFELRPKTGDLQQPKSNRQSMSFSQESMCNPIISVQTIQNTRLTRNITIIVMLLL